MTTTENFKYVNKMMYSDVVPFEVVERKSERKIIIREMKCERAPSFKPEFVAGGCSAHCTNQAQQKWIIKSDEEARLVTITKRKDGDWYEVGDKYTPFMFGKWVRDPESPSFKKLVDEPMKKYDYNF